MYRSLYEFNMAIRSFWNEMRSSVGYSMSNRESDEQGETESPFDSFSCLSCRGPLKRSRIYGIT